MLEEYKRRVAYINEMIESGHADELVAEGEAYHAEQLTRIAREIVSRGARVVLIAGPSSSGKTSTSYKLCLELLAQGKQPVALSLDNWYLNGTLTPLKPDGTKDYESVYAIDLHQLEDDLKALVAGQEILLPTFNFADETREYPGETLSLEKEAVLVMEGIHALNPILTRHLRDEDKFKIFASPMSPVSLDGDSSRYTAFEYHFCVRFSFRNEACHPHGTDAVEYGLSHFHHSKCTNSPESFCKGRADNIKIHRYSSPDGNFLCRPHQFGSPF